MKNTSQNYIYGAALLTVSATVMKILGAIYKIPLGNILGDSGYAYFLVAYAIFDTLINVVAGGLLLSLSRMVSETNALGKQHQLRHIYKVSLLTFGTLGAVGGLFMFFFSNQLAQALGAPSAASSIAVLSPAVFLLCITYVYRGYSQGMSNMLPTTVSQIVEVCVKVAVGLGAALIFTGLGAQLSTISAATMLGTLGGAAFALLCVVPMVRKAHFGKNPSDKSETSEKSPIFKRLILVGIPISLTTSLISIITFADTSIVINRLQSAAGFAVEQANILYGVYGKTIALYGISPAFILPLTVSILPALYACVVRSQKQQTEGIINSALRLTSVIALPVGIGLSTLPGPIMDVVFPGSHSSGQDILRLMGIASVLLCMTMISTSILQALGRERVPVLAITLGLLTKIAFTYVLVGHEPLNILGAPLGTIACYIVMLTVNFVFLCRACSLKLSLIKIFSAPLTATAAMSAVAALSHLAMSSVLGLTSDSGFILQAMALAVAVLAAALVYAFLVIKLGAITRADLISIPKGEKIANTLRIH